MVQKFIAAILATLALGATAAPASFPTAVHVHTSSAEGFATNSVWIDDGKEVTVIDTQFTPQLARTLLADIAAQTRSPVRRVIVTHASPDKFNALSVFHEAGAESVASAATARRLEGVHAYKRNYWVQVAKAFTAQTYPALERPRRVFQDTLVVPLGNGDRLTLSTLQGTAVSASHTVVRLDSTGDLIVGDLVANRTHAWLEGAVDSGRPVFDLAGWQASLKALPALTGPRPQARLFAGRGPALPVVQAVREQQQYLAAAAEAIAREEARLGADRAALADPTRQGAVIQAVRAALVSAFPDHAMPDLVSYSLYGWLSSRGR